MAGVSVSATYAATRVPLRREWGRPAGEDESAAAATCSLGSGLGWALRILYAPITAGEGERTGFPLPEPKGSAPGGMGRPSVDRATGRNHLRALGLCPKALCAVGGATERRTRPP